MKTITLKDVEGYLKGVNPETSLATAERVQIIVGREIHDLTILRTEATRELNTFPTPKSMKNYQETVLRVAFLPSKQKAAETRRYGEFWRSITNEFNIQIDDCYYPRNLCTKCPRCVLFGATNVSSKDMPNIKHRVEYSTAYSLLPFEEIDTSVTFNAVDEVTSNVGSALGETIGVAPSHLFLSTITLRSPTKLELISFVKNLLATTRYGAETRLYGSVRNKILGVVFSWEEVITPLELVLEASDLYLENKDINAEEITKLLDQYSKEAAYPEKVIVAENVSEFVETLQKYKYTKDDIESMKKYAEEIHSVKKAKSK